jgi:two-component system nitrogen regulation response regulator GlnG
MAPAQLIEPKDLPPEIGVSRADAAQPKPVAASLPFIAEVAPTPVAPPPYFSEAAPLGATAVVPSDSLQPWEHGLEAEAIALLGSGRLDVWDVLTKRFESRLILAALASTKGRRIEAAHKLGIGRNTITRKIQELGLE